MLLLVSKVFRVKHDVMEQFPPLGNLKVLLESQGKDCEASIIANHSSS